jgi:soluble lytic murein transglycosylase-like protein
MVSFGSAFADEAAEGESKGIDFGAITSAIFNPSGKSSETKQNSKFSGLINRYARKHGVPTRLANAIVRVESNFNPKARGRAGEVGLMQIKLGTARMMGYRGSRKGLYDPETNIKYGMKYLAGAHKLAGGDTCGTVLRYNAGHGAKRMNPVSSRYCKKVRKITG